MSIGRYDFVNDTTTTAATVGSSGGGAADGELDFDVSATMTKVLIGFGLSFMILASICGNLLVCIAVCTDHSLRKLGNLFVVSLAIADLLVASVVMVFATINDLMDRWVFGDKFCDTWIAMDVMCSTASIINLCAISLDRYIYIEDPYRYSRWMSKKTVTLLIGCIWIVAGLVSFLPISLGLHKPSVLAGGSSDALSAVGNPAPAHRAASAQMSLSPPSAAPGLVATVNRYFDEPAAAAATILRTHGEAILSPPGSPADGAGSGVSFPDSNMQCALDLTPTYAVVSSCVSFYVPCIVMVILYYRLYHYALKHVRSIKQMTRPLQLGSVNGKPGTTVASEYQVSEHKAAVTIGVVVGVFLVCWVPFFCANIAEAFCKCVPKTTFQALTWLGYCNSSLNPLIYSIFNTEFRYAFHKIIAHRCPWLLCRCCGACCPDRGAKGGGSHHETQAAARRMEQRAGSAGTRLSSQAEVASSRYSINVELNGVSLMVKTGSRGSADLARVGDNVVAVNNVSYAPPPPPPQTPIQQQQQQQTVVCNNGSRLSLTLPTHPLHQHVHQSPSPYGSSATSMVPITTSPACRSTMV